MSTISAGITVSVDGYFTGPGDGPERGLGVGGERLHYWVFGGPWTYASEHDLGDATGADQEFLEEGMSRAGAVVCGRRTYESSGRWGGNNPFPVSLFVLTHRVEDQPDESAGFSFVPDLGTAISRAREAAGDKAVHLMGGGELIRQALAAGVVDELVISTAPVILGGGRLLFDGYAGDHDLEKVRTWDSPLATHVQYRVVRGASRR